MSKSFSRSDSTSEEVVGSSRCAYPLCSLIDFLPFECDCCGQIYCLEHRTYRAHECTKSASKDTVAIVCPLCQLTLQMRGTDDANQVSNNVLLNPNLLIFIWKTAVKVTRSKGF